MKKNLFFWAAASIALASCSGEDVIELNNGNAIDFRVTPNRSVISRGAETTEGNIGQFVVTAIDGSDVYFSHELFTKTTKENSNLYESASEYFWPGTRELKFYAYSYYSGLNGSALNPIDDKKLGTVTIDASTQKIEGFSPAAEVENQVDFVTACATGSYKDEVNGVELSFNHNLIQTEVKAFSKNKNYSFTIVGVKFGNIESKGDFKFVGTADPTKGEWSIIADNKTDYTVEYNDIVLSENTDDLSDIKTVGHMMLLPQQLEGCKMDEANKADITNKSYIAVKIKIFRTNGDNGANGTRVFPAPTSGEEYGWAYIPVSTEWTMGNRYVYTLDFSRGAGYDEKGDPILGEPISFTAAVEKWQEATQANTDMHVKNN